MFQRLQKNFNLDFLDNKIAEEQENQRQQSKGSPSSRGQSNAAARRGSGAARGRGGRPQGSNDRTSNLGPAVKGPDPEDFVIGEDASDPSRVSTPAPSVPLTGSSADTRGAEEKQNDVKEAAGSDELPLEVQRKLAKLETLTTRYQELLRNYRTAHAHVAIIEPFEAALREHTPLTSISDPNALVEFLNQRGLQSEMVMSELKRVTAENKSIIQERDELKVKLDEAERKTKEAFDEAAGLRRDQDSSAKVQPTKQPVSLDDPLGANTMKSASASDVKPSGSTKDEKDEFFSYDDEIVKADTDSQRNAEQVAHLQEELKGQQAYATEILTENASLRQDLEVVRLDLSAMENKIRIRDDQITDLSEKLGTADTELEQARQLSQDATQQNTLRENSGQKEIATLQDQLKQRTAELDETTSQLDAHKATVEELKRDLAKQSDHLKNDKRDVKRMETLQNLVNTLKAQVRTADESKKTAESKVNDLQFELKRLEAEINSSENIISKLRGHESEANGLKRRIAEAENERDTAKRLAESKKGHEMAAASLRSQLKRTEKDRDTAYQMIIDCGKCGDLEKEKEADDGVGEEHEHEHASSTENRPQGDVEALEEVSQSHDGHQEAHVNDTTATSDAKKKNKKKKSKAKKKSVEEAVPTVADTGIPTLDELRQNPAQGLDVLLKGKLAGNPLGPHLVNYVEILKERSDARDDDHDSLLRHHEDMIEQQGQTIKNNDILIRAQNEEIFALKKDITDRAAPASVVAERDARIESLSREVHSLQYIIKEKDVEIGKLQDRLKGEAELTQQIEDLTEETETLRDSLVENGKKATDALHELKSAKETNQKLKDEQEVLEASNAKTTGDLRESEEQKERMVAKCSALEAEIEGLKANASSREELQSAEDQLQKLKEEKDLLQADKLAYEAQITELKTQFSTSQADFEAQRGDLDKELTSSRARATDIERELAAANQLAQTRFKDLTDLRELYNKVQPELKRLREESTELKSIKSDLDKANAGLKKLESKERDLRSEIAAYKTQLSQKDGEIASLKDQGKQSVERSTALEESYEMARRDLEKSESTRDEAVDARERLQSELRNLEDQLKKTRASLNDSEAQIKRYTDEASRAREELELRSAQQASAQSLMDSLQDQTREFAAQMKEARERNESLDEELADAHRLLSERSREGETMRRLLADVEGRAEARVKEMRERMDLATEERDQAEDKASTIARRKTRELDDLRIKLQDANTEASRATAARETAERRERDAQSRHDELDRRATQATEELAEIRTAMAQLRDALDEGERQSRSLEKEKAELRRTLDERDARLEKLQKSSRIMADEFHSLQAAHRLRQTSQQHPHQQHHKHQPSDRHSSDNTPLASSPVAAAAMATRALSPTPRTPPRLNTSLGGGRDSPRPSQSAAGVDFVYLKTVLLQFLEQKEKKHQMQLVPVLGMLLHFDTQDEQKLTAAISAR